MPDPRDEFIDSCLWHGSLDKPAAILAAHPEIAAADIYTAAILGDDAAVRRFIAADPASATAKGGPRGWDALTYLCFSKYLRLDPSRSEGFVRAATALLDAGANPNTGFFDNSHMPTPEFESVLYGAAGVAGHAGVTRVLLERGGEPNDNETPYHAPEDYGNGAMKVLLESGKLTAQSLSWMLARKADVHDLDGLKLVLEHGGNPNMMTIWGVTALHQSVRRDNSRAMIGLLLDHGADATIPMHAGPTAVEIAARRGRRDVLELFEKRGVSMKLAPAAALIAACARNDLAAIGGAPQTVVREVVAAGGQPLVEFAGVGNTDGVARLIDLSVAIGAPHGAGDGYFDVTKGTTALHNAGWRAQHSTVKLLIERGAPLDVLDTKGRTPLNMAIKACVESYWTHRRSTESIAALVAAGASKKGVTLPTGYPEADALLG